MGCFSRLLFLLLLVTPLLALLQYPSPTFANLPKTEHAPEGHRSRRWVLETAETMNKVVDFDEAQMMIDGKEKEDDVARPLRVKRDWFATMSPEEVRDARTLLEMSIKRRHH
ncbi:unnamed protein product [Caenorhabditis sp. 36 PRJEB53466]|nr:unnamed protein product [Caenorhabditis sp. 36 PRJEB53466]